MPNDQEPRVEKLADMKEDKEVIGRSIEELNYEWTESHLMDNEKYYGKDISDDSPLWRQVSIAVAELTIEVLQELIQSQQD